MWTLVITVTVDISAVLTVITLSNMEEWDKNTYYYSLLHLGFQLSFPPVHFVEFYYQQYCTISPFSKLNIDGQQQASRFTHEVPLPISYSYRLYISWELHNSNHF